MASSLRDTLNRPIHDLRISVTDACNYRCHYCMPQEQFGETYSFLKKTERLSFEYIISLVKAFVKLGVSKVRLTGGEPLLRKNLPELVARIKAVQGVEDLAITTNGEILEKHLSDLINAGLDRINISLDTIDAKLFRQISGDRGDVQNVLNAIDAAAQSSLKSVKVNCVLQKNINDENFMELLERFCDTRVVVRLIEFMDVGNKNAWSPEKVVPFKQVLQMIQSRWAVSLLKPNYLGEVATRYKYDNHQGEIGFITSVSQPFCQDCSRARLSADGKFYTCLFSDKFHDLKPFLNFLHEQKQQTQQKHDGMDKLEQEIRVIWRNRKDRYSEIRHQIKSKADKVEMYVIGG